MIFKEVWGPETKHQLDLVFNTGAVSKCLPCQHRGLKNSVVIATKMITVGTALCLSFYTQPALVCVLPSSYWYLRLSFLGMVMKLRNTN